MAVDKLYFESEQYLEMGSLHDDSFNFEDNGAILEHCFLPLSLEQRATLLDLGSGRGHWSLLASIKGFDVVGFDFHPPAREMLSSFRFVEGDILSDAFPSAEFITCIDVLKYFTRPEISQVILPKMRMSMAVLIHTPGSEVDVIDDPAALTHISPTTLKGMCEKVSGTAFTLNFFYESTNTFLGPSVLWLPQGGSMDPYQLHAYAFRLADQLRRYGFYGFTISI